MALRNVTGARCTICGRTVSAGPETTVCPHCGGILDIEYDYDYIRDCFRKYPLSERNDPTMWRYLELLPVEGLGTFPRLRVGGSPLYKADALGKTLGIRELWIKDDGQNPTASLKDRASAMAVTKAVEAGKATIACSGGAEYLHLGAVTGPQGQGGSADDVRRNGDPGGGKLRGHLPDFCGGD